MNGSPHPARGPTGTATTGIAARRAVAPASGPLLDHRRRDPQGLRRARTGVARVSRLRLRVLLSRSACWMNPDFQIQSSRDLFGPAGWLRGACWLPPGAPNRRHPPAASFWLPRDATPAWGCCARTAFCADAACPAAAPAAAERLGMPLPGPWMPVAAGQRHSNRRTGLLMRKEMRVRTGARNIRHRTVRKPQVWRSTAPLAWPREPSRPGRSGCPRNDRYY